MKIVHASDIHGEWDRHFPLPPADLYVLSGDMLPNYPNLKVWHPTEGELELRYDRALRLLDVELVICLGRRIVPESEALGQVRWAEELSARSEGGRTLLGSPDSPVVIVRGNHDFVDIGPLFPMWNVVLEATEDPKERTAVVGGLKIGACRGVNDIAGEWSDELDGATFDERCRSIPDDLDVLVSHCPPLDVLDGYNFGKTNGHKRYSNEHYGSKGLFFYVSRRAMENRPLRLHMFGHVHEQGGKVEEHDGTVFSNAAQHVNELEI